jgi:hypothetical protein
MEIVIFPFNNEDDDLKTHISSQENFPPKENL